MNNCFRFTLGQSDTKTQARTGTITTAHGIIQTPVFVPVGTQGSIKSLDKDDLYALDIQLFFVNTYHMYLRPGMKHLLSRGGLHKFISWDRPIITDSGGFQIYSLGSKRFGKMSGEVSSEPLLLSLNDTGVRFRSHWDGSEHEFTPEASMDYQWDMGSDIHIAFDDCTPFPADHSLALSSMERTHRWAVRSLDRHVERKRIEEKNSDSTGGALYGSIQGSVYEDLRLQSTSYITSLPFDGFAIGGVSVGESKEDMKHVLDWVTPHLPVDKPRHLLGVGEIDDIFELISHGIDTFDCVGPTRLARMGKAYCRKESGNRIKTDHSDRYMIDITKSGYADTIAPIDAECACNTCKNYSLDYLYHLFRTRELLAYRLLTIHNLFFIRHLVDQISESIVNGTFIDLKEQWSYND